MIPLAIPIPIAFAFAIAIAITLSLSLVLFFSLLYFVQSNSFFRCFIIDQLLASSSSQHITYSYDRKKRSFVFSLLRIEALHIDCRISSSLSSLISSFPSYRFSFLSCISRSEARRRMLRTVTIH